MRSYPCYETQVAVAKQENQNKEMRMKNVTYVCEFCSGNASLFPVSNDRNVWWLHTCEFLHEITAAFFLKVLEYSGGDHHKSEDNSKIEVVRGTVINAVRENKNTLPKAAS